VVHSFWVLLVVLVGTWKNEMRCLLSFVSLCSASVGVVVRLQQALVDGHHVAGSTVAFGLVVRPELLCLLEQVFRASFLPIGFAFESLWPCDSDSNPG